MTLTFTVKHTIIAVVLSIMVLFMPIYWAFDRLPPYVYKDVEIKPHEVRQGDEVEFTFWAIQTRKGCGAGLVYREYKELGTPDRPVGKVHTYDPVQRADEPVLLGKDGKPVAMGELGWFTRKAVISASIAAGPTEYRGEACYPCNPVHKWFRWPVCAVAPAKEFVVLPKQ